MKKLILTWLWIVCVQLLHFRTTDGFVIGVVYERSSSSAEQVRSVLKKAERNQGWMPAVQAVNVTFVHWPVTLSEPWPACGIITNETVVVMVIGNCQFLWDFYRDVVESGFPLPVVLLELDPVSACLQGALIGPVFSGNCLHQWLPLAASDCLMSLHITELIIVYSDQYLNHATALVRHLSAKHVHSSLMSLPHFAAARQGVGVGAPNLTVFAAVTSSDAIELFLQQDSASETWLVFTGDSTQRPNLTRISQAFQLTFTPTFTSAPALTPDSCARDCQNNHIYTFAMTLVYALGDAQLAETRSMESRCGQQEQDVPYAAGQFTEYLSRNVFDDTGHLKTDVYEIAVTSPDGQHQTGSWSRQSGLNLPPLSRAVDPQQMFVNKTIVVAYNLADPFVKQEDGGHNGTLVGFCVDMLQELAQRMGFRYKLVQSVDKLFGAMNADGSWDGMIGMGVRQEIDLAIGPLSITEERAAVVDFTLPYMEGSAGILMKKFEDKTAKMFSTFLPFTLRLWLSFLGFIVVISFGFGIINRFSPSRTKAGGSSEQWVEDMWDSAWIIFSSFMEQGAEKFPRSASGRLVLGLWWVFTIMFTASYTANLAAFLTFSTETKPIDSLEDLAAQSQILPLSLYSGSFYAMFKKGETETHRRIFEMMQKAPRISSYEDGMRLVLAGGYALLTDREQLDLMQKADCQSLVQASQFFNRNGFGFLLPLGHALRDPLSHNMIKMMESGLLDKWRRKWWSSKDVCTADQGASSEVLSLDLQTTAGPFFVFGLSTTLAVLFLLAERACYSLWPAFKAAVRGRRAQVV